MRVASTDRMRVLHVDDDPEFAELTATVLETEEEGLAVETVGSTEEALSRLADESFDCVVSDYDMAGQTGIEFLRTVRETNPTLPFILFTGKGSEEVASEAISAGVSDYLRKDTGMERFELLANRITNHVNRTRAQRDLEEREAHLKHAQAMANLGSWYADVDEDELVLSEEGRNILGIPSGETLDFEGYLTYVHPDDRADVVADWKRALGGAEYDIEHRVVPSDGDVRWVRERADVEFDDEGEPVSGVGMVQDITEHKERQQRLREERDRREALFQNPRDAILEIEFDDGRPMIKSVNETFTELFGYEPESVLGRSVTEVLVPDDEATEDRHEEINRSVLQGESVEVEVRRQTQSGVRDFHVRVFPFDATDCEQAAYGVYTDITERKQRELELQRYERMANTAGDMVYILDEDGVMAFVNDAAARLTGYEADELVGEHVRLIMADESDVDRGRSLIRRFLSSSDPASSGSFEWTLETAAGETLPCESHITLLEEDGEWAGTVGVIRDITERKQREEQLENFTRIVSHDLRNPLNVAGGRLELARTECDSDHLDEVASALDRMETLIDDLLTLSQVGSDCAELDRVDLTRLTEDAWRHVATAGATLVTEGDRAIRADRTRLQQLFENLIRNAVEHGGEDVRVTVGVLPDETGFYVADDGPGIPASERDEVLESGYTETNGGTGFGLAIVQEIAEGVHDWDVSVTESGEGGARFEFTGVEFVP